MTDKNNSYKEKTIGQLFGSLGGRATSKKYGKKHFKQLAKKMWEKKRQAQTDIVRSS